MEKLMKKDDEKEIVLVQRQPQKAKRQKDREATQATPSKKN